MITDAEFVAIKAFDRTIERNTAHAQSIINDKNRALVACHGEIARLRAALASETGKRRHAELQLAQRRH